MIFSFSHGYTLRLRSLNKVCSYIPIPSTLIDPIEDSQGVNPPPSNFAAEGGNATGTPSGPARRLAVTTGTSPPSRPSPSPSAACALRSATWRAPAAWARWWRSTSTCCPLPATAPSGATPTTTGSRRRGRGSGGAASGSPTTAILVCPNVKIKIWTKCYRFPPQCRRVPPPLHLPRRLQERLRGLDLQRELLRIRLELNTRILFF